MLELLGGVPWNDVGTPVVEVDVYNDGRIIVDGASMSLEDFRAAMPKWKTERKMLSYYHEFRLEGEAAAADDAGSVVFDAGITFSPRFMGQ